MNVEKYVPHPQIIVRSVLTGLLLLGLSGCDRGSQRWSAVYCDRTGCTKGSIERTFNGYGETCPPTYGIKESKLTIANRFPVSVETEKIFFLKQGTCVIIDP